MSVKSKVSSKLSGLAKHADMLGAVVGYLGTFATASKAEGGEFMSTIIARHVNAVKIHNVARLQDLPARLVNDPNWGSMTMTGLTLGIVGLITSYLPSLVPWQGTAASIMKKAGFGMAIGGGAALIISEISEGSGGSTVDGASFSSSSSASSSSPTGRTTRGVYGDFAPPSPYVGTWVRPR